MTYIGQRGLTLPSTGLDILLRVASNHSLVHTFLDLGPVYKEGGLP